MTDIAERLYNPFHMHDSAVMKEAAEEIETLRGRVAELESAKQICPVCASKIDEAAGIDLVELKQQLAAVENDYAICKHSLEQLKHDLIRKNAQLAACERERADWEFVGKSMSERFSETSNKLAASQHYAQQLRDALLNERSAQRRMDHFKMTADALAIPNDTSAIDRLKAGYELKIETLREMVARWMCDEGWDQCDMDEVDRLDSTQGTSALVLLGETRDEGVVWFDKNPHAFPKGTQFYAAIDAKGVG